jgi:hypothetical protein
VMKAWFVGFDLATLALVVALLRRIGRPVGWSVAYGWCPLVLKEVANSAHLDALTVFLTTLALYLAVRVLYDRPAGPAHAPGGGRSGTAVAMAAGFALGLAVGAKLYPVILAPLLVVSFARRLGWRCALAPLAAFGLTTALVLGPMVPQRPGGGSPPGAAARAGGEDGPPLPPMESFSEPAPPEPGLAAFASEWEMNDFLFLILMENLRPYADLPPHERAWFSVVPEPWRVALIARVQARLAIEPGRVPFFLSRAITSVLFVVLAAWFAWRARDAREATDWLRAAFLTVAWFWLLLPTLNPWYWLWAVPLLPFARNRAWLAISGLTFLYYLRFWLTYHYAETPVLGTRYPGPWFFDYVVTWLEFGPWFFWLGMQTRKGW